MDPRTPHDLTILTGASRGLGHALAEQLLRPGHILLCLSRHVQDDLVHCAQQRDAHLEQWVQDLNEPQEAATRLQHWLHSLHAPAIRSATLINNAAGMPAIGPLQHCPPEALAQSVRVGLEAPMQLTAAFLRATQHWCEQGWEGPRKVLNISSGLGRRASAGQAPYCAVKAGLDHFSRCTALDEARQPNGALIVSLAPGVIDTDMQTQLRDSDPALFPDRDRYVALQTTGQLSSAQHAASQVLACLRDPRFGQETIADVRHWEKH